MRTVLHLIQLLVAILPLSQAKAEEQNSVPLSEPISMQFKVVVDGNVVPVYLARVCNLGAEQRRPLRLPEEDQTSRCSFASFDLTGSSKVTITCPSLIQSVKVLPTARGIVASTKGNTASFTLAQAGAITVEVNGNWIESLEIFADPAEANIPKSTDSNVIYFGPGVYEVEHLQVHSGQTVYLARGAILYGKPSGDEPGRAILDLVGDDITLCGRGIIDGSLCPRGTRNILFAQGKNITVEGVILRDSGGWNFPIRQSNHVKVDNLEIFGWRGNSDGIDICNCQRVEVLNCFLRTFDDLIVLKTDKGQGQEQDIRVHDCVLWNEFAHALSLGAELRENLSDVHFYNCDVIHDKGREWLLRVYNCDSATVSGVSWENIRIEEARRLISLWIGQAGWSAEPERGQIQNITFRGITSVTPEVRGSTAALSGYDTAHTISGVLFQHVHINGQTFKVEDVTQNWFVRRDCFAMTLAEEPALGGVSFSFL